MSIARRVWSLGLILGILALALAATSEAAQFNW